MYINIDNHTKCKESGCRCVTCCSFVGLVSFVSLVRLFLFYKKVELYIHIHNLLRQPYIIVGIFLQRVVASLYSVFSEDEQEAIF